MKIAIVGSIKTYPKILDVKKTLEKLGHSIVFYPVPFKSELTKKIKPSDKLKTMQRFNRTLPQADALLVMNLSQQGKPNHIGSNTLMEIGAAFYLGKKIFLYNPAPQFFQDEAHAIGARVLHQNTKVIK